MRERTELSCYTNLGNGVSSVESLVCRARQLGIETIAITDGNSVLSYFEAEKIAKRYSFNIIYGVILPIWRGAWDIHFGDHEMKEYEYATVLAKNKDGIKSIYELLSVTLTECEDIEKEPELSVDDIIKHKGNLIVGSEDILFSEQDYLIVRPDMTKEEVIETLKKGEEFGFPVVAVGDVTYSGPDDSLLNEIINGTDGKPLLSTEEMLKKFDYLPKTKVEEIVITNSNIIADKIERNTEPISSDFYYTEGEEQFKELQTAAYKKLKELYGDNPPEEVLKRLETELEFVSRPYNITQFYIAFKLCDFAHKKGYPTGIRGLVPNSFVAFLLGISEINPLEYNLPYESFFGFSGDKVTDIDINFPDIIKSDVDGYLKELYGEEYVLKAGTVSCGYSYKWAVHIAEEYLYKKQKAWKQEELNCVSNLLMNSGMKSWRNGEGIHPGGLILLPKGYSVYDFTPLKNQNGIVSTHFDFHSLQDLGLLKVDALGHLAYTFLKELSDETGVKIEDIPLDDKAVWQLFDDLDTDYIPEFGTEFVKSMLRICRPKCFDDLVKICGISHGTDIWRDNAETLITRGVVELKDIMANREDVFDFLLSKGVDRASAFRAMEIVRKGAASKRQDSKDFIYSLSIKYNLPHWWTESVCKIRYMFPRGHAVSFVLLALRLAHFKTHYPDAFMELHKKLYREEE